MSHPPARELRTILLPTDFSDTGADAQEMAVRLAQRLGARLVCLHVVEPAKADADAEIEAQRVAEEERRAEPALARLAHGLHLREVPVEVRSAVGDPHAEIVRVAEREHADFVVIGTHGRGGLTRAILGSVAEQVVRHAPCPVLTVRPGTAAGTARRPAPADRG